MEILELSCYLRVQLQIKFVYTEICFQLPNIIFSLWIIHSSSSQLSFCQKNSSDRVVHQKITKYVCTWIFKSELMFSVCATWFTSSRHAERIASYVVIEDRYASNCCCVLHLEQFCYSNTLLSVSLIFNILM